jgi:CRISPR-associated protein (TIGR03984 family)
MCREISECSYSIAPVDVGDAFLTDESGWLAGQAQAHRLTTLLAHAHDGVIWGQLAAGKLLLSHDVFPNVSPELRSQTLQQLRLFGEDAELLVWRDGDGQWRARLLSDEGTGRPGWRFDESQLLWGDHREKEKQGFTLVAEGRQGLRHAVPTPDGSIPFGDPGSHPLRLGVRHYLEQDSDGMLVIAHSRLTGLQIEGQEGSHD